MVGHSELHMYTLLVEYFYSAGAHQERCRLAQYVLLERADFATRSAEPRDRLSGPFFAVACDAALHRGRG
jgi:hypothetical protein